MPTTTASSTTSSPVDRTLGLTVACTIYVALASAALRSTPTYDIGLAYSGGVVAWETGRPESLPTWISTPVLGAIVAIVSRLLTATAAAALLTVVTIIVAAAGLALCLYHLYPLVARRLWWTSAILCGFFAPLLSSTWWKQFNILALALAALGWYFLRSDRPALAAGLIALSVMLKPIVVLVPILLLLRRDLRKVGILCVAGSTMMLLCAKLFMAWRGGTLSPLPDLRKFSESSDPAKIWSCHPENLSPTSYACRLVGAGSFDAQRIAVLGLMAVLGFGLWQAYRHRPSQDWAWFAAACVLSPMISPIAWAHYQVVLLPSFFVVLAHVRHSSARASWLALLGAAYGLCSLSLQPYGSLIGWIRRNLLNKPPETIEEMFAGIAFAGAAQFLILLLLFQISTVPSRAKVDELKVSLRPDLH